MKVYNTAAIARLLDLSERRVRQLRDEGIILEYRTGSGLFDLTPTVNAYIRYLRRESDGGDVVGIHTERALLVRAKRRSEEYDLQLKEGELHETEEIERIYATMLSNFRTRLLSIPAKVTPRVKGKTSDADISAILKAEIDETLNELSNFDFEQYREDDNETADDIII
jgi:phage terminase Nu1 subunit (DNA packaging protein)